MILVIGNCKKCKTHWRIPDAPNFEDMEPELIDIALQVLRIHCPTCACLGTTSVIDLDRNLQVHSSQDSRGEPIYSGDRVRHGEVEYVIDAVKIGKNSAGASLVQLIDGPLVSEWSIDKL